VLFSISGHRDLKMNEINEVAKLISENVDQSARIIFGAYYDRKLNKGQLKVTLIATGFNGSLPDFFSQKTNSVIASEAKQSQEESLDQEIVFEETKKKEKTKEKKSEEVWDIPTFLRKKRR